MLYFSRMNAAAASRDNVKNILGGFLSHGSLLSPTHAYPCLPFHSIRTDPDDSGNYSRPTLCSVVTWSDSGLIVTRVLTAYLWILLQCKNKIKETQTFVLNRKCLVVFLSLRKHLLPLELITYLPTKSQPWTNLPSTSLTKLHLRQPSDCKPSDAVVAAGIHAAARRACARHTLIVIIARLTIWSFGLTRPRAGAELICSTLPGPTPALPSGAQQREALRVPRARQPEGLLLETGAVVTTPRAWFTVIIAGAAACRLRWRFGERMTRVRQAVEVSRTGAADCETRLAASGGAVLFLGAVWTEAVGDADAHADLLTVAAGAVTVQQTRQVCHQAKKSGCGRGREVARVIRISIVSAMKAIGVFARIGMFMWLGRLTECMFFTVLFSLFMSWNRRF